MKKYRLTIVVIIGIVLLIGYMFMAQPITAEVKLEVFKSLDSVKDLREVKDLTMNIYGRNTLEGPQLIYKTKDLKKIREMINFLGDYKCRVDYNQGRNIEALEGYFIHAKTEDETYFSIYLCKKYLVITSKMHGSGPRFAIVEDEIDFNFLEEFVESIEKQ